MHTRINTPWTLQLQKLIFETDALSIILLFLAFFLFLVPSHGFFAAIIVGLFLGIFVATCLLFGRTIACLLPVEITGIFEFPFVFSNGYLCSCLVILLFCYTLPVPILVSFGLTFLLSIFGQYMVGWKKAKTLSPNNPSTRIISAICVLVAAISTAEWTSVQRKVFELRNGFYVLPQWADTFFHTGLIATFSESRGCFDLQNAWLAGTRLPVYHYATYMPAAVLRNVSGFMPLELYTRLYMPMGVFILILAAYSLARQWWNSEAALIASCAIFLIPDGSWHGLVKNHVYSFDWLVIASPNLGIGIALLVLIWSMMMTACAQGSRIGVVCGFFCAGLLVLFKVQLFVGTSFLLWFYPILFFKGISLLYRGLYFGIATIILGCVWYLESRTSLPQVVINGTGGLEPIAFLENFHIGGFYLKHGNGISIVDYLLAAIYLFAAVLGWWGIFWIILIKSKFIGTVTQIKKWFPILVVVNFLLSYLLMDRTGVNYNEFLHRPLVWMYFVVVVFTSAGFYALLISKMESRLLIVRVLIGGVFIACLMFPLKLARKNINPMRMAALSNFQIPTGFVECGLFLAKKSNSGDLIQDASADTHLYLQAFTGRREWLSTIYLNGAYAGNRDTGRITQAVDAVRMGQLQKWLSMTDAQQIQNFAVQEHIRWLIIDETTPPAWSQLVADKIAFASSGYKVVKFF